MAFVFFIFMFDTWAKEILEETFLIRFAKAQRELSEAEGAVINTKKDYQGIL